MPKCGIGTFKVKRRYMNQYRITYEALFLPRPLKGFEYKGKHIIETVV